MRLMGGARGRGATAVRGAPPATSPVPDILPLLLPVCGLCYGPSLLGPRRLLRRRPLPWIVPRRPWSFSFYRYPSRFLFLRATGPQKEEPQSTAFLMATFPPRVFGYRPCLCDHETHVKRAKKWRHNAKQAYLKMVESPLVSATIMVDFKKMQALFENEEKDNDLIHAGGEISGAPRRFVVAPFLARAPARRAGLPCVRREGRGR